MRILLAQINSWIGDCSRNIDRILEVVEAAKRANIDLVVTPELSLCGYPVGDWLLRPEFLIYCEEELQRLVQAIVGDVTVIVGFPEYAQGSCFNAAAVICNQKIMGVYRKQKLPNYGVFDECRYFSPGNRPFVFACGAHRIGLMICEDVWHKEPAQQAKVAGAEILIVVNGSPYHTEQSLLRGETLRSRVHEVKLPIVYCNRVGGQDELIFDGASCAFDSAGKLVQQLPSFTEAVAVVPTHRLLKKTSGRASVLRGKSPLQADLYAASVLGLRDYVIKNHFKRVLVGVSGGVDSALTLTMAVDALGASAVQAIMLPSRYNAAISLEDAQLLAKNLQVDQKIVPIEPIFSLYLDTLKTLFNADLQGTTEENLQARIRGTVLMALSNQVGALLLNTSNKSELAMGYGTLYGDMVGGFAVLKDLDKTRVYQLAWYRNQLGQIIPERVLTRAPSAELRENQTDQDSLPPYALLDAVLRGYIEGGEGSGELQKKGFSPALVADVVDRIHRNEYKRAQAPPGSRLTAKAFGKDWRYPLTSRVIGR